MNPPIPTTKPNSLTRPAHSSDAEFELLDDGSTDLGLSELRLDGDQARSSRGIEERKPERSENGVDVVDMTSVRALRQNILSKFHAEESSHIPAPNQVKMFFTSDVRPSLAILQSGDGVVELDLSPNIIRVLPENLVFWSKSSSRGSVGFFIQRRHPDDPEYHDTAAGPSNGGPASVNSDPCNFELLTPSKDSTALVYWGTMRVLPDTLPDLHEQELKALPRQTRNDLCDVLDQPDQLDFKRSSLTNDSDTALSESVPKLKCIGFRRVGMNPGLCGKAEWSRQKLSPVAREYLLARRTDPDLVPLLDIPKTARRIRRLPKASKVQTPERNPSAYSSDSPTTRLEFQPTAITGTTRRSIQDLSTDFDILGIDPPVFRASKRKRDESTVVTTGDTDGLLVGPTKGKTRRVETSDGLEEETEAKDTGQKKSKKTERKMKKSRARKKQDREIRKMAAVLDGLSIGQLDSDEDSVMEK